MTARTPGEIYDCFRDCYLAKDVPGMLALYEPGACFVTEDGRVARSPAAIGAELSALLALGSRLWLDPPEVVALVDLAQLHSAWGPDGGGPDGRWLLVIDNPFGGAR